MFTFKELESSNAPRLGSMTSLKISAPDESSLNSIVGRDVIEVGRIPDKKKCSSRENSEEGVKARLRDGE